MASSATFGRTVQLFLVDDTPDGLMIASINGWTGSVLVSTQSTFGRLMKRAEVERAGIYILYGPDPKDGLRTRAYIGEADSVRGRVGESAGKRGFWETAVVVTTSDETLSKGHVRYLESRLIDMAKSAGRTVLDNVQLPDSEKRHLPESDRANMEAFLANLRLILPIIGLDLLKPAPTHHKLPKAGISFVLRHKSGVKASAVEEGGEFVVLEGSEALKDTGYAPSSYAKLKQAMIIDRVLEPTSDGNRYLFTRSYAFQSPSAADSVVLDRNTNGRNRWRLANSDMSYHEWQAGNLNREYDKNADAM